MYYSDTRNRKRRVYCHSLQLSQKGELKLAVDQYVIQTLLGGVDPPDFR